MVAAPLLRVGRHTGAGLFHALAELGNARITPPRDAREGVRRLASALGAIARAHGIDVAVRGTPPRGPSLLVANHVSYLDPLAILPIHPAAPLAKHEVASWPVIGPIGSALGVVFVEREAPLGRVRALRALGALLEAGISVLNFPEGTTTAGERVAPFRRGTFGIARRAGVPIVPIAIRYRDPALAWTDGATFLPHYLRTAARHRVEITLDFGAPLTHRRSDRAEDVASRARAVIADALLRSR